MHQNIVALQEISYGIVGVPVNIRMKKREGYIIAPNDRCAKIQFFVKSEN